MEQPLSCGDNVPRTYGLLRLPRGCEEMRIPRVGWQAGSQSRGTDCTSPSAQMGQAEHLSSGLPVAGPEDLEKRLPVPISLGPGWVSVSPRVGLRPPQDARPAPFRMRMLGGGGFSCDGTTRLPLILPGSTPPHPLTTLQLLIPILRLTLKPRVESSLRRHQVNAPGYHESLPPPRLCSLSVSWEVSPRRGQPPQCL